MKKEVISDDLIIRNRPSDGNDKSFSPLLYVRDGFRWFGHVERMDEYSVARRVLMAEVRRVRERGRPRFGWMDGVKQSLYTKGS